MAENAAFFWLLHDKALAGSDYDLSEMVELELRIQAQLDGLLSYKEDGWQACLTALQFDEPGEIFTAAYFAFASGDSQKIQLAVEAGCNKQENFSAMLSALAWLPFASIQNWLGKLMQSTLPEHLCLGLCACALHRANCGEHLTKILAGGYLDSSPEYLSLTLRAISLMQNDNAQYDLSKYHAHSEEGVVFSSLYTSLKQGDGNAMSLIRNYVFSDTKINDISVTDKAIQVVFRVLPAEEAKKWIQDLGKEPDSLRTVIKSIAILGDPTVLPWLLKLMAQDETARLAGNAFSLITGLDLELEKMVKRVTDSDEMDENTLEEPDSDFPWPDAAKISAWYALNSGHFLYGNRYLAGKLISEEQCTAVLSHGKQSHRIAAYHELSIMGSNSVFNENPKRLRI